MRILAAVALSAIAAGFLTPLAASPAGASPVPAATYSPGSIDGQNGWSGTGIPINPNIDQEVVANSGAPAVFGGQSWRMSNAYTNGSFGDHAFSPSVVNEAGETAAVNNGLSGGTRQTSFAAQWDFSSADPSGEQSGLGITVSPDRGDGARMSWVRMEDSPSGLRVLFNDYATDGLAGCDDFVQTELVAGLDRTTAHTARIEIGFVNGAANDVVRVYVDGALEFTGTSWEDYFRDCEGVQTRTVDSLLFQSRGTAAPGTDGNGFLIDNVSISTGTSGSTFSTGFEGPDESGPAITITTPQDGEDYDLDANVPADYACTDPSGVTACVGSVPDGASIDTSTSGEHTFFVFAKDVLGNTSSEEVTYTVTDDTAPTVTIITPADGATYAVGQNVIADFTCEDEAGSGLETDGLETGGSGIESCDGTVDDGDAIDTSAVGDHDFTVTGTDEAGNETEVTNTYTVVARPTCMGETVTVDLALGEEPTTGDDVIQGTPGDDTIDTLEGDDHVCGLDGADVINTGVGDDAALGGNGADQLNGATGDDRLLGSVGGDTLRGGAGTDVLGGGLGRDQVFGGLGPDRLNGGAQRDACDGGPDTDVAQLCEVRTNIP